MSLDFLEGLAKKRTTNEAGDIALTQDNLDGMFKLWKALPDIIEKVRAGERLVEAMEEIMDSANAKESMDGTENAIEDAIRAYHTVLPKKGGNHSIDVNGYCNMGCC